MITVRLKDEFLSLVGLYRALQEDHPDRELIRRLLKFWCRVTVVKNCRTVHLKSRLLETAYGRGLVELIEEYENTNEFIPALLECEAKLIRQWIKDRTCQTRTTESGWWWGGGAKVFTTQPRYLPPKQNQNFRVDYILAFHFEGMIISSIEIVKFVKCLEMYSVLGARFESL